jgi:DNA-binding IclR family transcriptional regulator
LEILLFLHDRPEKIFSMEEVFREIQSSPASVRQRLNELCDRRLAGQTGEGGYRFSPGTAELGKSVDQLKTCYAVWRVKVIEAVYSRESDGIQIFSDAFKFRKKE